MKLLRALLILSALVIALAVQAHVNPQTAQAQQEITYEQAHSACYAQKRFEFESCMILEGNAPTAAYPCLQRANRLYRLCMFAHGF